jgi:hypothetical protein
VSLPGADELFRTTGGTALQASTPRQHANGETAPQVSERLRSVPAPATEADPGTGPEAAAHDGAAPRPERTSGPGGSGTPAGSGASGASVATGAAAERARPAHEAARTETAPAPAPADHAHPATSEPQTPAVPASRRSAQEHAGQQRRRERRGAPNRRPSGRERHDEKITVYVSAEELIDLEHARLVLRGEHGLAVDRGRIVREAVAVVLADLESRGDASILVRRLRGR